MNYKILGDSDCPIVEITLRNNESVKIERGSMAYLRGVEIEGKFNSSRRGISGFLGAVGRSFTSGESMFITHARGTCDNGKIGIAPSTPGKIVPLKIDAFNQYRLNTGAFVACDDNVNYVMKSQSLGKAFFGGTGGLFVMETKGEGTILVSAFGDIVELEVTPDKDLIVDNEHVVAWDASLNYNIEIASGMFGFTTGEGLVNHFYGSGKVYIQTRNIHSLASAIDPFITKGSN